MPTKIRFIINLSYFFNILFWNKILSYFAKPNFIIYDEWFDDNLQKNKLDVKNKQIKNISNLHEFFYEHSNYKVGASENNLQLEIKVNKKELINKIYTESSSDKYSSLTNKNFRLFEKLIKNKLKFNLTKNTIYFLSIVGFLSILGFIIFFVSQSKKNESNINNKTIVLEKGF